MRSVPATGIYIHWPYCDRICPYCDFNVVRNRAVDMARWRQVLSEDIAFWSERTGRRNISSIYFGGGTPSLMTPELVADVIAQIAARFYLSEDAEITLEANPTDAELGQFTAFNAARVNRLSLGVQSFDDQQLKFLGRNHDGALAQKALVTALAVFPQVTFDLIYALPQETLNAWTERLARALDFGAQHLSLYQLTIEPSTAFAKAVARKAWVPIDDDMAAEFYQATQEKMTVTGLPAYEVSNYAAPEAKARHNSLYWQGADWIGIGPGAHGRLSLEGTRWESAGLSSVKKYLGAPQEARYVQAVLTPRDVAVERIAGGLRPIGGMPLADLSQDVQGKILPVQHQLTSDGFLAEDKLRLVAMPKGRLLIDTIVRLLTENI